MYTTPYPSGTIKHYKGNVVIVSEIAIIIAIFFIAIFSLVCMIGGNGLLEITKLFLGSIA